MGSLAQHNGTSAADLQLSSINVAEAKKKLDKPLLRRKSELPTDVLTQKSLETYQRADEFLTTPPKTEGGQNEG